MVVSSITDSVGQLVSRLLQRQWAEWEIITIAAVVVCMFLWIIRQQRKRGFRNIYDNKFLENTPVIGTKLGPHKRRISMIRDFKKAQLTAERQGHTKQHKSATRTESEKLHEQIRELQREIIKRKKSEVSLEEKVAYLTSINDKLQLEHAELKQSERTAGSSDEVQQTEVEQQQPIVPESERIEQGDETQKVEAPAQDEHVERKASRKGKAYEDTHRIVDDVKQKLCRKCNEWKPESEFHKNASSKDSLAASCKACKAEAAKEYRRRRKAARD